MSIGFEVHVPYFIELYSLRNGKLNIYVRETTPQEQNTALYAARDLAQIFDDNKEIKADV